MMSASLVFLLASALASALSPQEEGKPLLKRDVRPILEKHCFRRHGPEKQKSKLRLDTLDPDVIGGSAEETWHEVLNKVSRGEMPPEKEPRPPESGGRSWAGSPRSSPFCRSKTVRRRKRRIVRKRPHINLVHSPGVLEILPPHSIAHFEIQSIGHFGSLNDGALAYYRTLDAGSRFFKLKSGTVFE